MCWGLRWKFNMCDVRFRTETYKQNSIFSVSFEDVISPDTHGILEFVPYLLSTKLIGTFSTHFPRASKKKFHPQSVHESAQIHTVNRLFWGENNTKHNTSSVNSTLGHICFLQRIMIITRRLIPDETQCSRRD